MTNSVTTIATVTPVYSGAKYLPELMESLAALRRRWKEAGAPLELVESVFVDDAAVDESPAVLAALQEAHPWVRVVSLSRNFGQHPATVAGILRSSADWVITLDEDMQHDPALIPKLLREAVSEQRDIVYGKPTEAVHGSLLRDMGSRGYKRLLAWLTANPHIVKFNSFRAVRGGLARAAASVCGHETYLDVALSWFSQRIGVIDLPLKDRRFLEKRASGYDIWKLLSHARRLIVSSQTKVLRLGALIGVLALLLTFGLAVKALWGYWFGIASEVKGWTSTFMGIVFFGGVSCFLLTVALEYLTTVLLHAQGKPTYFEIDRRGDATLREYFEANPD